MPLMRISLRAGKSSAYKERLALETYHALRETFNVPEDDLFAVIHEHEADQFFYGKTYFDIARSDDLVIIQLNVSDTRDIVQKKALYARITEKLCTDPGLRPEDIFIHLVECKAENWSFGHGQAQYAL